MKKGKVLVLLLMIFACLPVSTYAVTGGGPSRGVFYQADIFFNVSNKNGAVCYDREGNKQSEIISYGKQVRVNKFPNAINGNEYYRVSNSEEGEDCFLLPINDLTFVDSYDYRLDDEATINKYNSLKVKIMIDGAPILKGPSTLYSEVKKGVKIPAGTELDADWMDEYFVHVTYNGVSGYVQLYMPTLNKKLTGYAALIMGTYEYKLNSTVTATKGEETVKLNKGTKFVFDIISNSNRSNYYGRLERERCDGEQCEIYVDGEEYIIDDDAKLFTKQSYLTASDSNYKTYVNVDVYNNNMKKVDTLKANSKYKILYIIYADDNGFWFYIKYENGKTGWINEIGFLIEKSMPFEHDTLPIYEDVNIYELPNSGNFLDLYTDSSPAAKVIGTIPKGTVLNDIEASETYDWIVPIYKITYNDVTGFVDTSIFSYNYETYNNDSDIDSTETDNNEDTEESKINVLALQLAIAGVFFAGVILLYLFITKKQNKSTL